MKTFCINRNDRPERWANAVEEFKRMGIEVTRYPAKIYQYGWKGCRDSHLSLLVRADAEKEEVTVFEDDVLFLGDSEWYWEQYGLALDELPWGWDILYLGASPQEPLTPYSDHLYRLGKAYCTHAMVWNPHGRAIDAVINADIRYEIGKWDVYLSEKIHPHFNVFITKPILCTQRQYQSDTCKRSDVSTILKNYNKFAV